MSMLLLCALAALSDVTSARYPDADAVLVDECEKVAYAADGTSETTDESWTKVLTEKGRRDESVVRLDYSRRYGEASIVSVGIIGTNGVERSVDTRATTHESTDNGAMGANIYDPLDRQIVCTIPGLKVGETVHLKTHRRTTKPRCVGKWADLSVLEWSRPIVRASYEVVAPKERPLKRIAVRNPLGNLERKTLAGPNGGSIHLFTVTNVPQAFPEPDMPALHTQVQRVHVSTSSDWPEISRWYWELSVPHLAKTNAAMVAKVNALVKPYRVEQRLERIRAIFRFVSQEVRYMGLTMEDTSPGYAPHDVNITFDNRYGVCRDKAGLLVALLRLAGFKAFPVLINVGAKLDAEVPQPFFNHAVVAVERSDAARRQGAARYLLMDPTNENTKDIFPAYLDNRSFLVSRPEGEQLLTTPVTSPDVNRLAIASRGKVARDGSLTLENKIAFSGINDTLYRGAFARRTPEDRVKWIERLLKSVAAGAEIMTCTILPEDMRDTETPVSIAVSARIPAAVLTGNTQDELALPMLSKEMGLANFLLQGNTALAQRKYPLVLDATACVDETMTLDVSVLGAPRTLPPAVSFGAGCSFARQMAFTNGSLSVSRRFAVSAVEFSPREYDALRADMKRIEAAERVLPIFARDPLKDANICTREHTTAVDIHSPRCWTITNRVVREVLSYKGKKSAAELKFSYNPTWQNVTLLEASVSNRDGRVYAVKPTEVNEMDCGWAASAPRYPAGRIRIVNLPSVEIGSVISYCTVQTVTNAPVSYYGTFAFDAHEPLLRRCVRVNDWSRTVVAPSRIPDEPHPAPAAFWRDEIVVSSNDFAAAARALQTACDVPAIDPSTVGIVGETPRTMMCAVRDWMARYVRLSGPSLYEVPLALQTTDPAVVLRERYAACLDYIRTLVALLRGAGLTADIVFAAADADLGVAARRRLMHEKPNVRAFAQPLCRVTLVEGGFLGFGGDTRTYFIGTENQYAELGATALEGADYLDPSDGSFGLVTVPAENLCARREDTVEIRVRETCAADMSVVSSLYGPSVAGFRKTYAEILPEERSRRYQALLGDIAQAATATSELETDVTAYPARRAFACYIPDYATCAGDSMTLVLPPLEGDLPTFTGNVRLTPFAVDAADALTERYVVYFPEGYDVLEHAPENFTFADPRAPEKVWIRNAVTSRRADGALVVTVERTILPRKEAWYAKDFIGLVKERGRAEDSRANRTIVVRRVRKGNNK